MKQALNISIELDWEPVERSPGQPYHFPKDATDYTREKYSSPAVYRWNVFEAKPGDLNTYSFSETGNLSNRIYQYRNPTREQAAQSKVKVRLTDAITSGKTALLERADVEGFELGGQMLTHDALQDPAARKLLEQLLVFYHVRLGHTVWNVLKEPDARELLKW